jgi:ferric-dicitrate binding protein FerR (iron transport regulator)
MATTFSSESDVLAALRAGDEHALEQLFRDHYAALTAEAAGELENPSVAPVVVERAFLHAWDERTRFDSAPALESFLHDEVHEGAVRERQRRSALHHIAERSGAHHAHHAKHATAPAPRATVDESWAHLIAALHSAPPTVDAGAAERRAQMYRHEAAEHVQSVTKHGNALVAWGLVAGGAIAVAGMMWVLNRTGAEVATTNALASPKARATTSAPGQRGLVTLLDGTRVTIGPESKLVVPEEFPKSPRAVQLEGTASFAVAAGQDKPFEVRAGKASLTTTATSAVTSEFAVSAFPEDSVVTLRVHDGSVTVTTPTESRTVPAGGALAITRDGAMREPTREAADEALGWTDEHLTIANRPLREVLPLLRRWYALDVKAPDASLLDRRVSMTAALGTPRNAITAIESTAANGVRFGWVSDTMVVQDATKPLPGKKTGKR